MNESALDLESWESDPPHLISIGSPEVDAGAGLQRAHGADYDLLWQVRESVADKVSAPVILPVRVGPHNLADAFVQNDVLIISSCVREVIEPWLKDYEFIEACLELSSDAQAWQTGGGDIVEGYWWLNSWRRLDAVDWTKSVVGLRTSAASGTSYDDRTPLRASGWNSLVLRDDLLHEEHFFGLAYLKGERRYLSKRLYRHLHSKKLRLNFEAVMMRGEDRINAGDIGRKLTEGHNLE